MRILQCEDFAAAIHQEFALVLGEATMVLTLTEVTPLPVQAYKGIIRAPFSLIFRSQVQLILPQRIYRLENASMGSQEIFLVPVGRDAAGVVYQAIFN